MVSVKKAQHDFTSSGCKQRPDLAVSPLSRPTRTMQRPLEGQMLKVTKGHTKQEFKTHKHKHNLQLKVLNYSNSCSKGTYGIKTTTELVPIILVYIFTRISAGPLSK